MKSILCAKDNIKKNIKLMFIICSLFVLASCGKTDVKVPEYDDSLDPAKEVSTFVIITDIDQVNGKITVRAVDRDEELKLTYTGGVDARDKYDSVMSMSLVELGMPADIVYDENRDKLLSLKELPEEKVSKRTGVTGIEIDPIKNTATIGGKAYNISFGAAAFSDDKEIEFNEILPEDELTIWMYNDEILSVNVEVGHGYVKLRDYESYIGGTVEIGYDVIETVTEDMVLTVKEGEYTLRIKKDNDVGTKDIKVIRNNEIIVSLADIAIEPTEMGSILFKLTPSDAQVYIDGKRVNTEGAVSIPYGKHKILIKKEGYQSYAASFNVNYAYKIKEYTLVTTAEASADSSKKSGEDVTTTEKSGKTTSAETTTESSTKEKTTEKSSTTEKSNNSNAKDVSTKTGEKTSNKVTIKAPDGVSVYFDGEFIGIAPISFTKVTGSHIITLSKSGYLSKSYTVTFSDDGKDEVLTYDALQSMSSLIGN